MTTTKINKGRRVWVSPTAQNSNLDQAGFEAITDWVEVMHVVTVGETGTSESDVTQNEWGTDVVQHQKGIANAGAPTIEVGENLSDPGQIAMNAAAATPDNYALRFQDVLLAGQTTPRMEYNRGLISGPVNTNGGVEDFNNATYTCLLNQRRIVVNAT